MTIPTKENPPKRGNRIPSIESAAEITEEDILAAQAAWRREVDPMYRRLLDASVIPDRNA